MLETWPGDKKMFILQSKKKFLQNLPEIIEIKAP